MSKLPLPQRASFVGSPLSSLRYSEDLVALLFRLLFFFAKIQSKIARETLLLTPSQFEIVICLENVHRIKLLHHLFYRFGRFVYER